MYEKEELNDEWCTAIKLFFPFLNYVIKILVIEIIVTFTHENSTELYAYIYTWSNANKYSCRHPEIVVKISCLHDKQSARWWRKTRVHRLANFAAQNWNACSYRWHNYHFVCQTEIISFFIRDEESDIEKSIDHSCIVDGWSIDFPPLARS